MQTLLAKLVTENRFFWFFPVAFALIGVLAAEIVCIIFLTRKILSAKKGEDPAKKLSGTDLSPMLILLVSPSGIRARETTLLVLGILALAGALALVVLFAICYKKGYLFVHIKTEKVPARKISVFDFLPEKSQQKQESKPPKKEKEEDINSAIAAFADMEEETVTTGPETYVPMYRTEPFAEKYDDYADEEESEGEDPDEEDVLDDDPDAEEDFEDEYQSDDPDSFTGNERIVGYDAETDSNIIARYRKSFEAKLIQSQPHIKRYYSAIKNTLLSYKGTKSRMSWTADSFHNGRTQIAKINVKTRILELYLALDPASLQGTVYRGQDVGALRKYEETPFRYKIRTPRKLNWALELIRRVCEEHGLSPIDIEPVDYERQYPFDTMDNLVKRKLVKVATRLEKVSSSYEYDPTGQRRSRESMDLPQSEEISWDFDNIEEKAIPVKKSAGFYKPYQEETAFVYEEEEPEPVYEEKEEPAPTFEEVEEVELPYEEEQEAEQLSYEEEEETAPVEKEEGDANAEEGEPEFSPEEEEPAQAATATERNVDPGLAQVDVSLLDLHFKDGDYVTIDILKRRGLIFSGATRLKIRATGKMRHKLTIVANQFTYDALLAIGEAGGDAQFIR